jgi:hypothetical protein
MAQTQMKSRCPADGIQVGCPVETGTRKLFALLAIDRGRFSSNTAVVRGNIVLIRLRAYRGHFWMFFGEFQWLI